MLLYSMTTNHSHSAILKGKKAFFLSYWMLIKRPISKSKLLFLFASSSCFSKMDSSILRTAQHKERLVYNLVLLKVFTFQCHSHKVYLDTAILKSTVKLHRDPDAHSVHSYIIASMFHGKWIAISQLMHYSKSTGLTSTPHVQRQLFQNQTYCTPLYQWGST